MSTIDALTCPECGLGQNAHMYNCSRNPFGSEIDAFKRTVAAQTSGLNLPRTESAVNHSESASVAALQEIDQLRDEHDAALAEVDRLNHWQENYANEMQRKFDELAAGAVAVQEAATRARELLQRWADQIKDCHTTESGDWEDEHEAEEDYNELMVVIRDLDLDPIRARRELLEPVAWPTKYEQRDVPVGWDGLSAYENGWNAAIEACRDAARTGGNKT